MQALVSAVASFNVSPAIPLSIPPYLLFHLAKTHGTWHASLVLLRQHQVRMENRDGGRDPMLDVTRECQATLLLMLNEHDAWVGHQRTRFKTSPETLKALAYEQLVCVL